MRGTNNAVPAHDVQEVLMLWSTWRYGNSPCAYGVPTSCTTAMDGRSTENAGAIFSQKKALRRGPL